MKGAFEVVVQVDVPVGGFASVSHPDLRLLPVRGWTQGRSQERAESQITSFHRPRGAGFGPVVELHMGLILISSAAYVVWLFLFCLHSLANLSGAA